MIMDKKIRQPKEGSKEEALRSMRAAKIKPRQKRDDPTLAIIAQAVATAQEFTCTILKDRRYITLREKTLAGARALRPQIEAEANNHRKAMIYAVTPDGMTHFVPDSYVEPDDSMAASAAATQAEAKPEAESKESDVRNNHQTTKKTAKAKARTAVKAKTTSKHRYDWAGAEEKAAKGTIPPPPDFSAPTHKYFRDVLAEVVKAAKAGDKGALAKIKVNPTSSSPKAVARYRKICLAALSA